MLTYLTTEQMWGSFTALTLNAPFDMQQTVNNIKGNRHVLTKVEKGVHIIDVPTFRGAQLRQKKPDSPLKFRQKPAAPNSDTSSCSSLLVQVSMFKATSWEMALSVSRCCVQRESCSLHWHSILSLSLLMLSVFRLLRCKFLLICES